jgi:hypothetical protein
MATQSRDPEEKRCPVCGRGVLVDLGFDADPPGGPDVPQQQPDARQTARYSCGHEVLGAALSTADAETLDVERRSADEGVDPAP